ncbi:MAG: sulfite exporter TauE/SafE family protein [Actinomycetota bacterium]|nr:sulfite exporter TauE/SafE family protein [Actinomycetota bacterium]
MSPAHALVVAGAGLVAGAVNAVAGGGTLVTFPALLAVGNSALVANITSSVGLITGYLGGSIAYREELAGQRHRVRALGVVSVLGGAVGAVVLLVTPTSAFRGIVPFLILASCLLLLAQPRLAAAVARRRDAAEEPEEASDSDVGWPLRLLVFLGAVYGSYFGAGLGVVLLGVFGILLADNLQRLNALKGLLSLVINVVGVAIFLLSARVAWADAGILAVTAYAGGLLGVRLARRLKPAVLRYGVVVLGVAVATKLLISS